MYIQSIATRLRTIKYLKMLVTVEPPYHVLSVDEVVVPILKFESMDLVGQSILKIIGPNTDQGMFQSAILEAANLKSVLAHFILYDRYGEEINAIVSFCPLVHHSGVQCCKVTIEESEAITLDDGFEDSHCPHALLDAESPHRVIQVNEDFLSKFKCPQCQAIGSAFARFQGSNQVSWIPLLDAALRGKIARNKVPTSASPPPAEDDAICVPVIGGLNGKIRYILVLFSPCTTHRHFRPSQATHKNCDDFRNAPALPSFPCSTLPATASWQAAQSFVSNTPPLHTPSQEQHSHGVHPGNHNHPQRIRAAAALEDRPRLKPGSPTVIVPRGRGRMIQPERSAVVVTPALLTTLAGLPLPRAAAAVGVSTTALKKACRKLGLARWGFRRGAGRSARRGAQEHPQPGRMIGRAKRDGSVATADGERRRPRGVGSKGGSGAGAGASSPPPPPPPPPPLNSPNHHDGFTALEDCRCAAPPPPLLPAASLEGPGPGHPAAAVAVAPEPGDPVCIDSEEASGFPDSPSSSCCLLESALTSAPQQNPADCDADSEPAIMLLESMATAAAGADGAPACATWEDALGLDQPMTAWADGWPGWDGLSEALSCR